MTLIDVILLSALNKPSFSNYLHKRAEEATTTSSAPSSPPDGAIRPKSLPEGVVERLTAPSQTLNLPSHGFRPNNADFAGSLLTGASKAMTRSSSDMELLQQKLRNVAQETINPIGQIFGNVWKAIQTPTQKTPSVNIISTPR